MKRVSFSLYPGQANEYKAMVDDALQSRIIRNFIMNDYTLPKDLSVINKGEKKGLEVSPFRFDEFTDEKLNSLVEEVRKAGFKANRSSLMRHIMAQLIDKLKQQSGETAKDREIRHSSFYFEEGIKNLLEQYIPFRDRNAVIERFVLEEYKPRTNSLILYEKPEQPESMRISMSGNAFDKLDQYVKEIKTKGVNRSSVMRDVVAQIISKLSNSDAQKLIVETRLKQAIEEYRRVFGEEMLRETLSTYHTRKEE